MKRALITGITGQDGSYLAELLLSKGYEVHGIIRRASTFNTKRIDHIYQDPNSPSTRLFLHHGDLSSSEWVLNMVYSFAPDELYHLAAQSHVRVSFDMPEYTGDITGLGTMRLLEAIRRAGMQDAVLSGVEFGDVRVGAAAAKRNDNLSAAQPVCRRKSICILDDAHLPRGLQAFCKQRNLVQSRKPAARRDICDAKDYARGCGDRGRANRTLCFWAISKRGGTGVMRRSTWKRSGKCCSRTTARGYRHRNGRSTFGERVRGGGVFVRGTGLAKAYKKFGAVYEASGSGLLDRRYAKGARESWAGKRGLVSANWWR